MTGNKQSYTDYVLECLQPVGAISSGRFFGGIGVSVDGVQFAMMMGNALFFVVDDSTRPQYEQMGTGCFWYNTKKKKINVKKYHEVPGEWLDEQETLLQRAEESIRIARRLKK